MLNILVLWNHLQSVHKFIGKDPPNKIQPNQSTIPTAFQTAPSSLSFDQQMKFDNALIDWIASDQQPFDVVEDEKFRQFAMKLNPRYKLPSANHATKLFDDRFDKLVCQIKDETKTAEHPSYTLDLWKSIRSDYYCSIVLHYIDNDWILRHHLIATSLVTSNHSAASIGKLAAEKLLPFLGVINCSIFLLLIHLHDIIT